MVDFIQYHFKVNNWLVQLKFTYLASQIDTGFLLYEKTIKSRILMGNMWLVVGTTVKVNRWAKAP